MRGHKPFENDVETIGHYKYTGSSAPLSSKIANKRQSELIFSCLQNIEVKSIIDIGCGDGTYTAELVQVQEASVLGIDPSAKAIEFARVNNPSPERLTFSNVTLEEVYRNNRTFDCAILRGVLHHCEDPLEIVKLAGKVAKNVVILEPNGLNPILKIIEKTSSYHIAHGERSFSKKRIKGWILNSDLQIREIKFGVTVPFFAPDRLAVILDLFDPFVRKVPVLKHVFLSTQVFRTSK
jgi:SAM-dependent methyltransferase